MPDQNPRQSWRPRLRFRLSVRALMVLVLVLGGWLGWVVHRARAQCEAVAAIRHAGGQVSYDSDGDIDFGPKRRTWAPRWLVDSLGIDYFSSVDYVGFGKRGADAVAGQFARLPGLTVVEFNRSDLSDSGLALLQGLDIHHLSLSGTKVTDAGVRHIRGLANLEVLDLSSISVGDAGMAHIAHLPKVARLMVSDTNVTDLGVASIVKLPALKFLFLQGTKVGDRGATLLASRGGLEHIDLRRTRVSDEAIRALCAALPGVPVYSPSGL